MAIVIAAWVAGLLVFSSFFMKTMIPLRVVAIASNVAFISYALLGLKYGIFGRVYPILVLHSALLPLNVVRLREMKRLIEAVNRASSSEAFDSLIPYMTKERHREGEVLFSKGDPADRLYLIGEGSVRFPELGKQLSRGAVFGEVGLFARRACAPRARSVKSTAAFMRSPRTRCSSSTTKIRASASFSFGSSPESCSMMIRGRRRRAPSHSTWRPLTITPVTRAHRARGRRPSCHARAPRGAADRARSGAYRVREGRLAPHVRHRS